MRNDAAVLHLVNVVERWARRRGCDDDQTADAVAIAWEGWETHGRQWAAGHWAQIAVRAALAGRTVRGARYSRRSAWPMTELGGDMTGVADRRPGPARQAADREAWEMMRRAMNARQRLILRLAELGLARASICQRAGCSSSYVSQTLRRMVEQYRLYR